MSRVTTAVEMGLREYRRTPVLLALLVFLPAYLVGLFALVAPDSPAAVHVGGETVRTELTTALPAFTAPMAAALVTGIAGLFLMRATADADARLVLAGYRPWQVVLARLGLLGTVSAVATVVAVAVARLFVTPAAIAWFVAAVFLTGLVYGAVGAVAGLVLGRLAGVYAILFGSMVDLFLFQNPLATDAPEVATYLPGHFPLTLAVDAAFAPGVDASAAAWSLGAVAVLTAAASLAFYRATNA